ncbi:uncharacterized protein [Nicotiana tomentosiformis]|uniref:uncharacterized protein n=1 Tax=Nicotiana tomentosiformis TaxID=4098 RepID=UPI00388CC2E3
MEGAELASYCLKGVAYSWFEMWEDSREEGSHPARLSEFADAFIDHFMPAEIKPSRASKFENLKLGSTSVWEYHMRFAGLSKYAIYMLPTMDARVCWFVQGLSPLVINEAVIYALNSDMNYGKMVAFSQDTETRKRKNRMERESSNRARSAGTFSGTSGDSGGGRTAFKGGSSGSSQSFAQYSVSAPPSGPSQQQGNRFIPSHGNRGSYKQGRSAERFQQQRRRPCPRCGKMHFGTYYMDQPKCYECGMRGHIHRDYRSSHQSMGSGTAQPASSAATTSAAPPPARGTPASIGRGAARGGT